MPERRRLKILIGIFILIVFGIIFFFVYSDVLAKPQIVSISIADLNYKEESSNFVNKCSLCLERDLEVCSSIQMDENNFENCRTPAEILCAGGGISSQFDLQIKNFEFPVYCRVVSEKENLTNPFLAYNGLNLINEEFGKDLQKEYKIRVCCSVDANFKEESCSEEEFLNARCLSG